MSLAVRPITRVQAILHSIVDWQLLPEVISHQDIDWTLSDEKGKTAFHWLTTYRTSAAGVIHAIDVLSSRAWINDQDSDGNTPLHDLLFVLAEEHNNLASEETMNLLLHMVSLYLEVGSEMELKNTQGWTCYDVIHYRLPSRLRDYILDIVSKRSDNL